MPLSPPALQVVQSLEEIIIHQRKPTFIYERNLIVFSESIV